MAAHQQMALFSSSCQLTYLFPNEDKDRTSTLIKRAASSLQGGAVIEQLIRSMHLPVTIPPRMSFYPVAFLEMIEMMSKPIYMLKYCPVN